MTAPGGTCRFCAEALPDGAAKCPWCGEAQGHAAELRWEHDAVVVRGPGELPIGVCFGCASAGATRTRRLLGPRHGAIPHVDLPLCAACTRRADSLPMLGAAIVVVGVLAASCLWPILVAAGVAPLLMWATAAVVALMVLGLALTALQNARTRVSVSWQDGVARLRLHDARAVRRAVERDGI